MLSQCLHNSEMSLVSAARALQPSTLLRASIAVAVVTIAMKTLAWWITQSVGLLSRSEERRVGKEC